MPDFSLGLFLKRIKRFPSRLRSSGKFTVILIVLALISLWFYWFEYRPSRIREICDMEARESVINEIFGPKEELGEEIREFVKEVSALKDNYEKFYEACLHAKGLK